MALFQTLIPALCTLSLLFQIQPSYSATCTSQKFGRNRIFQHCNDLPQLNSHIHWTYDSSNSVLSLAFAAFPARPDGWIAWGINPNGTGMIGTQALIAFKKPGGDSMIVKTFRLNSYKSVEQAEIMYDVSRLEAEYHRGLMMIFATINLPNGMTTLNQVWQVGASVMNGTFPAIHAFQPENLSSKDKLDLRKGQSLTSTSQENSGLRSKQIHGALNTVSWGMLFPIGIMMARYLRTFADPAWFYVHISCQMSSYIVGVAGWATGLKLGSQSKGVEYTIHRDFGITLFCLATLQILALFLRPKRDHKYRFYWNIYHHGVGYGVLVLGIINVFKGLEMLDPPKKWKLAYIFFLAVLGGIAISLEVITWIVILKRKPGKSGISIKLYDGQKDSNGGQQPLTS
ncbi:cytochrome b561 and DOMON domain-containing protein At3g25290 [Coffea arabica]|uniref:Cytochrome b561 and DOMON domain-containing protein n=1 Tax=Coffea arabica TaxID=13443 RepID=A0A6P6WP52_COFAR